MIEATHCYRAYHLTADGHIARVEVLDAADDATALRQLEATANGFGIELWDRARVVGTAKPLELAIEAV